MEDLRRIDRKRQFLASGPVAVYCTVTETVLVIVTVQYSTVVGSVFGCSFFFYSIVVFELSTRREKNGYSWLVDLNAWMDWMDGWMDGWLKTKSIKIIIIIKSKKSPENKIK